MTRRRCLSLCLAGLLLAGAGCTAEQPTAEQDYTVAYYGGQEGPEGWTDVLVVATEQWNALGEDAQALFGRAGMIYVPGQAGADVSWGAGGLSAAADGEAEDSEKIGTALTLRGDTVHVNEVFAVKEGGEDAQAQDLGADPAGDGGQIADGIRAAMLVEGVRQVEMPAADGWSASGSRSAVVYDRDGDCAGIMGYTLYVAPFQSGEGTLFYDCYCRSLFVPEGTGRCEEMVVALDSPLAAGQVIDTAEPLAIALGDRAVGDGAPEAQVIRRFDLTTNERAWVFAPEVPRLGEGWAQLTGVRICADGADAACGVEVSLTLDSGTAEQAPSLTGYEPFAAP